MVSQGSLGRVTRRALKAPKLTELGPLCLLIWSGRRCLGKAKFPGVSY